MRLRSAFSAVVVEGGKQEIFRQVVLKGESCAHVGKEAIQKAKPPLVGESPNHSILVQTFGYHLFPGQDQRVPTH